MRRLTVSLDDVLERALAEAPQRLGVAKSAADAERLRAYARVGYEAILQDELDELRLATYRAWADEPELRGLARASLRRGARRGAPRC